MKKARFIVSLDFELFWGVYDSLGIGYKDNLYGVCNSVEEILKLFDKYNIRATWATVGALFNESFEELNKTKPSIEPDYSDQIPNPFKHVKNVDESLLFALKLLKLIKSASGQEIGSHSYSHYYSLEDGNNNEQFVSDINSAINISKEKLGVDLSSYVFPKNEINEEYLEILKDKGFESYRGTSKLKIYSKGQNLNLLQKALRFMDSYVNVFGKSVSETEFNKGLVNIKGDRFLRPHKNKFLSYLMRRRIYKEMESACLNNKNYHLWWHPHNFGINLKENLYNLERILIKYNDFNIKYGMISNNMLDVVNLEKR